MVKYRICEHLYDDLTPGMRKYTYPYMEIEVFGHFQDVLRAVKCLNVIEEAGRHFNGKNSGYLQCQM
jgi:hypothetical protein